MVSRFIGPSLVLLLVVFQADLVGARKGKQRKRGVGKVLVVASVDGAKVTIGGKEIGTTPLSEFVLAPGRYRLKVSKPGYLVFSKRLVVRAGQRRKIVADLMAFAGVLHVKCNVPSAKVRLNRKRIGKAPLQKEIKLGRQRVRVEAPGYMPYEKVISVAAGKEYNLDVVLEAVHSASIGQEESDLDDELELIALTPQNKSRPKNDELKLQPLDSNQKAPEASTNDDDDLKLLFLTPKNQANKSPGQNPNLLAVTPPKATPWWQQWYALTGGALAITAAVVIPVAVVASETKVDAKWELFSTNQSMTTAGLN